MEYEFPILLDHEMVQLWEACEDVQDDPQWARAAFLVRFMFCAPLRVSEMAKLHKRDFVTPSVIHVKGKGGKVRFVEIVPDFIPYVQWYEYHYVKEHIGWFFPSEQGKRSSRMGGRRTYDIPSKRQTLDKKWNAMLEKAGVRWVKMHSCRAAHACWFRNALSIQDLKDQLGHSRLSTTEKYYWVSVPGRRFDHYSQPQWLATMAEGAKRMKERLAEIKAREQVLGWRGKWKKMVSA